MEAKILFEYLRRRMDIIFLPLATPSMIGSGADK